MISQSFPSSILLNIFFEMALMINVWHMHLKTKNCLKICVKIRAGKKVCENTYNIV